MDKEILAQELAMRAKEEALLCYDKFNNEDALALGLKIIEKAKQRNAAVAMDIEVNGVQLFHYNMPGSNKRHCMWIRRKQNMVQASQCSTLHAMYQLIRDNKDQEKDWVLNQQKFAKIMGARLISYDCGHYIHHFKSDEMSEEILRFVNSFIL